MDPPAIAARDDDGLAASRTVDSQGLRVAADAQRLGRLRRSGNGRAAADEHQETKHPRHL
jgi:hypothetical protein